jgi:prefoldin alpha subunit
MSLTDTIKENNKMNQEQIMQFQMLEQEANKLSQQLQMIEGNITEINDIKEGLVEIEKNETKEILANIGKKIFIPVEIKDKNLIIEVGNKKFVKKSIGETKELIEDQLLKLENAKAEITEKLDSLQEEANMLMIQLQEGRTHSHNHSHGKDHECDCEEDCGDDCKCKETEGECDCSDEGCNCE